MPQSGEVTKHSQDLYALLGSPFERDFDMLDYKAWLDLPVSPNCSFFEGGPEAGFFNLLTGRDAQRGRDWSVAIGYVPAAQRLDFTDISIPLKSPRSNESLLFHRTRTGHFVAFMGQNGVETELKTAYTSDGQLTAIPAAFITHLMAEVGYGMPELFTSPDDLRLHMAELTDRATNWQVEESVCIPEDVNGQTKITRVLTSFNRNGRSEMDVQLTAVAEEVDYTSRQRDQLVVDFAGTDHMMHRPQIYFQRLRPANTGVTLPGEETYECVGRKNQQVTAKNIASLINAFLDTMTGNYS